MKPSRVVLSLAVCVGAYGQSPAPPASSAQKAFEVMKTLTGNWQGPVTTDSPAWSTDKPMSLSMRVASRGNAVIHELNTGGPEVTVFYVEDDRLKLVHYCDFGNRPLMTARPSPDGTKIEFDLVSSPGSDAVGHISHGVFTIIDANHHVEEWTFLPPGQKPVHARMEFGRVK